MVKSPKVLRESWEAWKSQVTTPMIHKHQRLTTLLAAAALATTLLAGCTGTNEVIQQAGSSTVFPIAEAWAAQMSKEGIQVVVAGGGSGAGATKICNKEVQIGDMSRPMKQSEIDTCRANGVEPLVWKVAYDGLTVVLHKDNDWVDHLTVAELNHIWRADNPAQMWSDVRESWPNQKIVLYGPDDDSGTYEYFNEVILDAEAPRTDYHPSADDNVLVEGVARSKYSIGHFGFAYYQGSQDRLQAAAIMDEGASKAVSPTFSTIADGSYSPLSRPIFMVTNGPPAEDTALHKYFTYAMNDGQALIQDVGYVELDEAVLTEQRGWL